MNDYVEIINDDMASGYTIRETMNDVMDVAAQRRELKKIFAGSEMPEQTRNHLRKNPGSDPNLSTVVRFFEAFGVRLTLETIR